MIDYRTLLFQPWLRYFRLFDNYSLGYVNADEGGPEVVDVSGFLPDICSLLFSIATPTETQDDVIQPDT